MKIHNDILELIGGTPLVKLNKIAPEGAYVAVKLEYFNPANSIKDRPAKHMLDKAIEQKIVNKETVIIEPTSGNTGIGLALCCAVKGLKLILTMPESMSIERRKMLKAYGADLILTPASEGMSGAVNKAKELWEKTPNSFMPSQFENPANPEIHYYTTAEEIFKDTFGKVDIVVAGIGTGGTVSGVGKKLKELKPEVKIYGVEPKDSPLLTKGVAGPHKIQGIGANFIPKNLDMNVVNEVFDVEYKDALTAAREMAVKEGILCGISSGAVVYQAIELAKMEENQGKLIVAITADYGERYLSTELFEE